MIHLLGLAFLLGAYVGVEAIRGRAPPEWRNHAQVLFFVVLVVTYLTIRWFAFDRERVTRLPAAQREVFRRWFRFGLIMLAGVPLFLLLTLVSPHAGPMMGILVIPYAAGALLFAFREKDRPVRKKDRTP